MGSQLAQRVDRDGDPDDGTDEVVGGGEVVSDGTDVEAEGGSKGGGAGVRPCLRTGACTRGSSF